MDEKITTKKECPYCGSTNVEIEIGYATGAGIYPAGQERYPKANRHIGDCGKCGKEFLFVSDK